MDKILEDDLIIGLLNQLTKQCRNLTWKIRSTYGNGFDEPIREISICEALDDRVIGRIAYRGFSGRVINYLYSGLHDAAPESIIDMLLDIINVEKNKSELLPTA